MESLLKERDQAQNIAVTMEQDCDDLKQRKVELGKGITACEKDISKAEDQLDKASTATRDCLEKLEKVTTTATSYEDQVQALARKIQLVEEEASRVNERLQDTARSDDNNWKILQSRVFDIFRLFQTIFGLLKRCGIFKRAVFYQNWHPPKSTTKKTSELEKLLTVET